MFDIDSFIIGLKKIFPDKKVEDDVHSILIKQPTIIRRENNTSEEKILFELQKDNLNDVINSLNCKNSESFALYEKKYYETAVRSQDARQFPLVRYIDEEQFVTNEHGYKLCVSKASLEYIFMLVCEVANTDAVDTDFFFSARHRISRGFEISSYSDFCDNFCLLTVKIVSEKECTNTEFTKMMAAYFFNISYNHNIVFSTINFSERGHQPIRKRLQRNGQLFPYKVYKNELIKYYNQAASATMPMTKYLAYYHVAEFFFQTIAEDDAYKTIESIITHPSFSPHNKDSIRSFYKKVKQIMRNQKEEGVWEEKNALLLCIKKYVPDLEQLKNAISDIDSNAISYYQNNYIPFAGNEQNNNESSKDKVKINFQDSPDTIYSTIRNRVYLVRNAIAHSKEGSHLRYEPFKDDKDLQKEIPLIRAISEEIIINSAKDMKL